MNSTHRNSTARRSSKAQRNERLGFVVVLLVIALAALFLQHGDAIFKFVFGM